MVASVPELANRHCGRPNLARQFCGGRDRGLGRLGEMRAALDLGPDCLDDGRVAVTGERDAVAAVQVDVLVAVDVVELGALAVAEPDRLRPGDLPAGHDAAG